MGQMLVRNLDDAVIDRIKRRAMENRTSAEEEVRQLINHSFGIDVEAVKARLKALRDRIGPQSGPSSTELLRADRDRDNED